MKKLINSPDTVLADALRGVAAAHPDLSVDLENRLVVSTAPREGRVALISGGGTGHEPLHSGFVGAGMLDAACAGAIEQGIHSYRHVKALTERRVAEALAALQTASPAPPAPTLTQQHALIRNADEYGDLFAHGAGVTQSLESIQP